MPDHAVTQILMAIEGGEKNRAADLLPLLYDELRRLARQQLAAERKDHTLQPTALVHEAYLRLVGPDVSGDSAPGDAPGVKFTGRRHFFAAAVEAMRRILIDHARTKKAAKRGGTRRRVELADDLVATFDPPFDLMDLDAALQRLAAEHPDAAELIRLRYFGGLKLLEVAELLELSPRSVDRLWAFARAWLLRELTAET